MNNSAETCAEKILIEPCLHSASSHCVACAAAIIKRERQEAKIEMCESPDTIGCQTIPSGEIVTLLEYGRILRAQLAALDSGGEGENNVV